MELNQSEIQLLKILDENFKSGGKPVSYRVIAVNLPAVKRLIKNEMIFQNADGYFISTLGQDYLANLSKQA